MIFESIYGICMKIPKQLVYIYTYCRCKVYIKTLIFYIRKNKMKLKNNMAT